MQDREISVTTYDGHRGAERPRSFIIEGRTIEVLELLSTRIEETVSDRVQKRFFVVKGDDDEVYTLVYAYSGGQWYVRNR